MSKNLKKILTTGASLLMFASVGAGISNVSNAHANIVDEEMAQGLKEDEQSNKNFDANSERAYTQHVWGLRNDRFYYKDIVNLLDAYPDLANTPQMDKITNYLSPKGRKQFDEYYFNVSSTDEGGNLKESSDAAAGLDYDPHNSADNYLPLKGQHYISTDKEKAMQTTSVSSLFNDDSKTKSKKHAKRVARHTKKARRDRKHNKQVSKVSKKSRKARKNRKHAKKSTKRTKLSKKQYNKLNKQLKKDKKALKSRRAKRSYKYRKVLNKTIKQLQKKMKMSK